VIESKWNEVGLRVEFQVCKGGEGEVGGETRELSRYRDPVAGIRGVPLLNENEETITNARVIPTLELFSGQRFVSRNQGNTYATQSPNKKKARNLLVNYFPHIPRWSRLHAVHFSLLSSDFFSLFPALVSPASPTVSTLDP
jgi:hypothetical protein